MEPEIINLINIKPTPEGVQEIQEFYKRIRGIELTFDEANDQLKRHLVLIKLLEIQQKKDQNSI